MLPQIPVSTTTPPLNQLPVVTVTFPIAHLAVTTHTAQAARRPLQDLDEAYGAECTPPTKVTRTEENPLPVMPQLTGDVAKWLAKPQETWTREDALTTIKLVKDGYFTSHATGNDAIVLFLEHLRTRVGDENFVEVLRLFNEVDISQACYTLFENHYGQKSAIASLLDLRIALSYLSISGKSNESVFNDLIVLLEETLLEKHGKAQLEQYYYEWRAGVDVLPGFKVENLGLCNADLFRLFSEPYFGTLKKCPNLNHAVWLHLCKIKPEELLAIPQWKTILVNYVSCIKHYDQLVEHQRNTLKIWIEKALEEDQITAGQNIHVSLPSPEVKSLLTYACRWTDFPLICQKGISIQGPCNKKMCGWLAKLWSACPGLNHQHIIAGNCSVSPRLSKTDRLFLAHFLPTKCIMCPLSVEDLISEPSGYKRIALFALYSKYNSNLANTLTLDRLNQFSNTRGVATDFAHSLFEWYFTLLAEKLLEKSSKELDPAVFQETFIWLYQTLAPNSKAFWQTLYRVADQHPQLLSNFHQFLLAFKQAKNSSACWALATWAKLLKGLPHYDKQERVRVSFHSPSVTPRTALAQALNAIRNYSSRFPDEAEIVLEAFKEFDRVWGTTLYPKLGKL